MNTKKLNNAKRISIVLDKPTREMLLNLSVSSGKSMSAVLRDAVKHGFITKEMFSALQKNRS